MPAKAGAGYARRGAASGAGRRFVGITWQWVRAEHNHDLADQRRRKAHQAIHDYFTLVSENKLLGKPGLQELRHELLGTALQYYQGFLAEWNEDRTMRAEVAATYVPVRAGRPAR